MEKSHFWFLSLHLLPPRNLQEEFSPPTVTPPYTSNITHSNLSPGCVYSLFGVIFDHGGFDLNICMFPYDLPESSRCNRRLVKIHLFLKQSGKLVDCVGWYFSEWLSACLEMPVTFGFLPCRCPFKMCPCTAVDELVLRSWTHCLG